MQTSRKRPAIAQLQPNRRGRRPRAIVAIATSSLTLFGAAGLATAIGHTASASSSGGLGCRPSTTVEVPQPTQAELDAAGLGDLNLAPDSARRDLTAAPFSDSTSVTNPLFPISGLHSAILNGHVDGKVFHTETTLLPFTRIIEWSPGQCVRVLTSQYMAFLDGRLQETAIDSYAQADDGSVWYLGESVSDYNFNGLINSTEGTWQAGIDGPFAMIMPSNPQVGDVNRAENIPGNSFEEVKVTKVDQTFDGPSGPVSGGIVARETHQDAAPSDKLFAPGYGEFRSTDGPDVEAMALAAPTDAIPGRVPDALVTMSRKADRIFASGLANQRQWSHAARLAQVMFNNWREFRAGDVPPRLVKPTNVALRELVASIAARQRFNTRSTAIDAAYASNDLQLRYRSVIKTDLVRFQLWTWRALLHSTEGAIGGARSDVVTLEWIRDRVAQTLGPVKLTRIDTLVGELGVAVDDRNLKAAALTARQLGAVLDRLT